MALRDAQKVLIGLLSKNAYQAEPRADLVTKNWLAVGKVSADDVVQMLMACKEADYDCYAHLDDRRTMVHDFRPRWHQRKWIIKGYLVGGSAMFISVHPAR